MANSQLVAPLSDNIKSALPRYVFRGVHMDGGSWVLSENPEPGDTASLSDFGPERHSFDVDLDPAQMHREWYYLVRGTLWGDYVGDDFQRSNYDVLLTRYPDIFVEGVGDYDTHQLLLRESFDLDPELLNDLHHMLLCDDPRLDDEHHQQLLEALLEEALTDRLLMDIQSEMFDRMGNRVLPEVEGFEDNDVIRQRAREYAATTGLTADNATSISFDVPSFFYWLGTRSATIIDKTWRGTHDDGTECEPSCPMYGDSHTSAL